MSSSSWALIRKTNLHYTENLWILRHLDIALGGGLVAKSCPTLATPPGSSVRGISQVRILEWVAISSPGDLSDLGTKLGSPALQADSLPTEPPGKPRYSS